MDSFFETAIKVCHVIVEVEFDSLSMVVVSSKKITAERPQNKGVNTHLEIILERPSPDIEDKERA